MYCDSESDIAPHYYCIKVVHVSAIKHACIMTFVLHIYVTSDKHQSITLLRQFSGGRETFLP